MIALLAPSRQFEGVVTVFPRRLHDFFTKEELSSPAVPTVDTTRVAQATYMRGWHTRACVATCAVPRRSPRIAQRDL